MGFFGYGVSLALFVMALRHLGTARTGAYFSTAPFIGTVVAVLFLREPVTTPAPDRRPAHGRSGSGCT